MIKVSNSVVINKPVEAVYGFSVDQNNTPKWQSGIESVQVPAGPVQTGTRFVVVRKFMGQEMKNAMEFTEVTPNRSFTMKSTDGPVSMQVTVTFEAEGGGTTVTTSLEGEAGGFFKVAEGLVAKQIESQIKTDAVKLKAVLEA